MHFKFKKHDKVRLLRAPDPEFIEYHNPDDEENSKETPIKKGMLGKVNMILSNGKYHVEILDEKGKTLAYAPFNEEDIEAV
jgi:hypothetical protein